MTGFNGTNAGEIAKHLKALKEVTIAVRESERQHRRCLDYMAGQQTVELLKEELLWQQRQVMGQSCRCRW
jgi:hypothetical protein